MAKEINELDHPIFIQSIAFIKQNLRASTLQPLEQTVLERLIHTSGDFVIQDLLTFSPTATAVAINALKAGSPILADTQMALAGIANMNRKTLNVPMKNILDWSPLKAPKGYTRSAVGMQKSWLDLTHQFQGNCSPIVLIGSAPTALIALLDLIAQGAQPPSLIIGMPVGFVSVIESKERLFQSGLPYISLHGSRGGASLAAAAINALMREAFIFNCNNPY